MRHGGDVYRVALNERIVYLMWSESISMLNPYEAMCASQNVEENLTNPKAVSLRHRIAICLRRIANKIDY